MYISTKLECKFLHIPRPLYVCLLKRSFESENSFIIYSPSCCFISVWCCCSFSAEHKRRWDVGNLQSWCQLTSIVVTKKHLIFSSVKRLIVINRIQKKSFCLHNMCVYVCMYIYFSNIYCMCVYLFIHNKYTWYTYGTYYVNKNVYFGCD